VTFENREPCSLLISSRLTFVALYRVPVVRVWRQLRVKHGSANRISPRKGIDTCIYMNEQSNIRRYDCKRQRVGLYTIISLRLNNENVETNESTTFFVRDIISYPDTHISYVALSCTQYLLNPTFHLHPSQLNMPSILSWDVDATFYSTRGYRTLVTINDLFKLTNPCGGLRKKIIGPTFVYYFEY
jgi:hypothetical protein